MSRTAKFFGTAGRASAAAKAERARQAEVDGLPCLTAVIDLNMEVFETVRAPGYCYTQEEIAEAWGCSRALIYVREKRALAKLRARVAARPELADALRLLMRQCSQREGGRRLA